MAKRSWLEANDSPLLSSSTGNAPFAGAGTTSGQRHRDIPPRSLPAHLTAGGALGKSNTSQAATAHGQSSTSEKPPQRRASIEISRKVKACAACRKQKVGCHMENGTPPCTRCKQRNLTCVLNKSLQMLMEEKSQWHQDIVQDLELLHRGLQETRAQSALVLLPPLRSSLPRIGSDTMDLAAQLVDEKDSERTSRMTNIFQDSIPSAAMAEDPRERADSPVFSFSFATTLPQFSRPPQQASHSFEEMGSPSLASGGSRDVVASGLISLLDAQRLFDVYIKVLDIFTGQIGSRWPTLEALRARSPILTASVMAVAALHDPESENIYPVCSQELRRLVSASLFDQPLDRDDLWALCLASYWLSDASWTLSGVAIRRALEVNLAGSYQRVVAEGSEDAADCLRLWYRLYLCDRNLSLVFGRDSLVRDDASVTGADAFLKTPVAGMYDQALVMMIGAHLIMGPIRDLFGPDNGMPIPTAYSTQIAFYSQQLDQWIGFWLHVLRGEATWLEGAARVASELRVKGAMLQYHFARLQLCSHAFRGLSSSAAIPDPLREAASTAVRAAIDSIELCLSDCDTGVSPGLQGMPFYTYAMLCSSCVFLLKVAVMRQDGLVEADLVSALAARLIHQFRSMRVSRWHPAWAIADVLENSAARYLGPRTTSSAKGKEVRRGSAGGSGSRSRALGFGNEMEEASQTVLGLYPGASTSAMHPSMLEIDEDTAGGGSSGTSIPGLSNPYLGTPSGLQGFFDFGGAAESGHEDDASRNC